MEAMNMEETAKEKTIERKHLMWKPLRKQLEMQW